MALKHQSSDFQNSLLDSTGFPLADLNSEHQQHATSALGRPSRKHIFAYVDLFAVCVSVICLVLSYLTITPEPSRINLPWRLRFTGQIIVIGFLLSIMNICMRTVLPYLFLLFEARSGPSRLQNYEAILTGKILRSHTSPIWRLVLALLTALPLGLSVAYKRFLNGTSNQIITLPQNVQQQYGIAFPQVGDHAISNDPIYLLITSYSPFQNATISNSYPTRDQFPVPYGYNTLLLANNSAAVLDLPSPSYLAAMQHMIAMSSKRGYEAWYINASVDAYVASYNSSTIDLRQDDNLWNQAISSALNYYYTLTSINLFNTHRIGVMPFGTGNQCYFGIYDSTSGEPEQIGYYYNSTTNYEIFQSFRNTASIFNIRRARCYGSWRIDDKSLNLIHGHCDNDVEIDQKLLEIRNYTHSGQLAPYALDTLPVFGHTLLQGSTESDWPWLNASYSFSMALSYWARAAFMSNVSSAVRDNNNVSYVSASETIMSQRSTLRADGLLYLVLTVQPFITILAFIVAMALQDVPIGRQFGIISLLSGFDASTSHLIRGATLSGDLKAPVRLEVTPVLSDQDAPVFDGAPDDNAKIRYRLVSPSNPGARLKLQKERLYW